MSVGSADQMSPAITEKSINSLIDEESCVSGSLKRFIGAQEKVLENFISKITYTKLVTTYSECCCSDDEFLDLHRQFTEQLADKIKKDLRTVYKDQKLIPKLIELDKLKKEAESSETDTAWRPSGNPAEDIRAHRWQQKLWYKKELESFLQDLKSQNSNIEQEVMKNHTEIMSLKEKIIELDKQNKTDMASLRLMDFKKIEDLQQNIEDS